MKHLRESTPTFEDWEELHGALSDAYFPHALQPRSVGRAARSGLEVVDLHSCRLAHIRFGATVRVVSEHPGAMAVNIPLTGHLQSQIGSRSYDVGPGRATAFPPNTPARMPAWTSEVDLLGFRIETDVLQRETERVFARKDIVVPQEIDLRTPDGQAWLRMARTTFDNARDGDGTLYRNPAVAASVASMLVTGLLLAAVPEEPGEATTLRPRPLRRVMRAIDLDPARAWAPADLAEIAGVSVRRLQQCFRENVGTTPLAYVHDVRLARIHDDLVNCRGENVTDVAMRWGVTHLGRFAAAYRLKYGQLPSHTLAASA